jgi:hypothetical protein
MYSSFEGCVTVHLFRESKLMITTRCNNCDLLMFLGSTCFGRLRPKHVEPRNINKAQLLHRVVIIRLLSHKVTALKVLWLFALVSGEDRPMGK